MNQLVKQAFLNALSKAFGAFASYTFEHVRASLLSNSGKFIVVGSRNIRATGTPEKRRVSARLTLIDLTSANSRTFEARYLLTYSAKRKRAQYRAEIKEVKK